MSDQSKIEWTDATWNPVRGCSRVSKGCRNCYAERQAARFSTTFEPDPGGMGTFERKGPFYEFAERTSAGPRWTGRVELIAEKLDEPLRWKKPRRIFVNSMSDLFHEKLSNEAIAAVFGVMAAAPQHTFQVLTKRPERMRRWFEWAKEDLRSDPAMLLDDATSALCLTVGKLSDFYRRSSGATWPLPNVWLGVSVENQATADERIPLLLQTPAALRFVSYEPAIGPVDFKNDWFKWWPTAASVPAYSLGKYIGDVPMPHGYRSDGPRLDWLIVGGESGPGARPCDLAWLRSAVAQCKAAGVPAFVKQLGARPVVRHENGQELRTAPTVKCYGSVAGAAGFCQHGVVLRDRKGGEPSEWPEDLRAREFPR